LRLTKELAEIKKEQKRKPKADSAASTSSPGVAQ
jgi:hypothetical protein